MHIRFRLTMVLLGESLLLAGCERTSVPATEGVSAAEATQTESRVIELNDMNFVAQISKGIALVDFWAPWCGPCRTQGPIVETVARQLGDTAKIAKINVDNAPATSKSFDIQSIPTLIVFKDGKPVKQFQGVTSAEELIEAIKAAQ